MRLLLVLLFWSAFDVSGQTTQGIFWEIKDPESGQSSYLLGTYHLLGNHFADSIPLPLARMREADLAIFESVELNPDRSYLRQLKPGGDYRRALKKRHVRALEQLAQDWEYPPSQMPAVFVRGKLQQLYFRDHCQNVLSTDTTKQLDQLLIALAIQAGVPVYGLETDSAQASLVLQNFEGATWSSLRKSIGFWLEAIENPDDNARLCQLSHTYQHGKVTLNLEQACPDDVLIARRNETWLQELPQLLSTQRCFIAVGYMHLDYDCGLVRQLQEQGFILTPQPLR